MKAKLYGFSHFSHCVIEVPFNEELDEQISYHKGRCLFQGRNPYYVVHVADLEISRQRPNWVYESKSAEIEITDDQYLTFARAWNEQRRSNSMFFDLVANAPRPLRKRTPAEITPKEVYYTTGLLKHQNRKVSPRDVRNHLNATADLVLTRGHHGKAYQLAKKGLGLPQKLAQIQRSD